MAQDPKGHVISYRISSYLPIQLLPPRIACVICILNCCIHVFPLYMNLNCVHGHHIRNHTELDDTSDIFRWHNVAHFSTFYYDLCAISDISNIKQPTKEHQTSNERRRELVMMSFDVCKSLTPIWLFSAYQTEWSGYYLFHFFQSAP